jgi:hypothetical protein
MNCYKCGSEIKHQGKIGRQDTCVQCGSYLHCCLNCRLYDPKAYHECREPQAEWVKEKDSGNFCEYFEAKTHSSVTGLSAAEEAKRKLDQLFKK